MDRSFAYGNPGGAAGDVATVRAIYEAFGRRDLEAALRHVSEDCVLVPSGTADAIGRREPYRGHAGVREYFADAARVWEDLSLEPDDVRAVGGGVVVFGHIVAHAEGRPVRRRVLWTWQLRDGLATSLRVTVLGDVPPTG